MAIIKYVPKEVPIKDYRNDKGGYYVATCDFCSREFYPKKRAKYCSHNCLVLSYRQRVAEGQVVKPRSNKKEVSIKEVSIKEVDNKVTIQAPGNQLIYKGNKSGLVDYLKNKYDVNKGDTRNVISNIGLFDNEADIISGKVYIVKINQLKYKLYKYI